MRVEIPEGFLPVSFYHAHHHYPHRENNKVKNCLKTVSYTHEGEEHMN